MPRLPQTPHLRKIYLQVEYLVVLLLRLDRHLHAATVQQVVYRVVYFGGDRRQEVLVQALHEPQDDSPRLPVLLL